MVVDDETRIISTTREDKERDEKMTTTKWTRNAWILWIASSLLLLLCCCC